MIKQKKSHLPKTIANLINFCKILDDLPINFRFKLTNAGKDLDGFWEKTISNGGTTWKNGSKISFNSSFFLLKNKVFKAIEVEGVPIRQIYFPDRRRKIFPPLTKEKLRELYYRRKKSLKEIGGEYKCSRQWIMALMKKYGLKRRPPLKARIEAIKQGRG